MHGTLPNPSLQLIEVSGVGAELAPLLGLAVGTEGLLRGRLEGQAHLLPDLGELGGELVHHGHGVVRGGGDAELLLALGHRGEVDGLDVVAVVADHLVRNLGREARVADLGNKDKRFTLMIFVVWVDFQRYLSEFG